MIALLAILYVAAWYSLPRAQGQTWSDNQRGLCPTCASQPCRCAIEKDPQWLDRLLKEAS